MTTTGKPIVLLMQATSGVYKSSVSSMSWDNRTFWFSGRHLEFPSKVGLHRNAAVKFETWMEPLGF